MLRFVASKNCFLFVVLEGMFIYIYTNIYMFLLEEYTHGIEMSQ